MALGGALVLFSVLRIQNGSSSRVLVSLGGVSYSLYDVFHSLVLQMFDHLVHNHCGILLPYSLQAVVGLALTIAMAAVPYRWLETPFLNLKQRFTHVLVA